MIFSKKSLSLSFNFGAIMNKLFSVKIISIAILTIVLSNSVLFSQTDVEDKFNPFKPDEKLKYYKKEGHELDIQHSFEETFNACVQAVEELGCQVMTKSYSQTDEGMYKGKVYSDYCVFVGKTDTTLDEIKRYSIAVPNIRGGVWINGRMQYKFILTELPDGNTHVKLKGEVSGREDYVTARVHFWESCGIFEKRILDRIEEILQSRKVE